MQYVYAALLLHASAQSINEESVKKVLSAAGIKPEESRVKALVAALSEVNIDEALKSAATVAVAPAPSGPSPEAKKEEKKPAEEKKKEEEALAGLESLFG